MLSRPVHSRLLFLEHRQWNRRESEKKSESPRREVFFWEMSFASHDAGSTLDLTSLFNRLFLRRLNFHDGDNSSSSNPIKHEPSLMFRRSTAFTNQEVASGNIVTLMVIHLGRHKARRGANLITIIVSSFRFTTANAGTLPGPTSRNDPPKQ